MVSLLLLAVLTGCAPGRVPLRVAHHAGWSGWYAVSTRADTPYGQRFERVRLGLTSPPCETVRSHGEHREGPIVVLVHGVKGDGPEWHQAVPALEATKPSSAWMYRWVPYEERDVIVERFGLGMTRLLQCLPESEQPVVVLAHSAGGVVASKGASRVAIPETRPRTEVLVLTVASPLAGTVQRERDSLGRAEARFMLDLGSAIESYPPPARGVRVVHLRTSAQADPVMQPGRDGRVPNDPGVGVPGAPQVELPQDLGHDQALLWVAERLADGSWQPLQQAE